MKSPNKIVYQQHPAIFLLEQWQMFLNGLDRVITFYNTDDKQLSYEAIEWNRQFHQTPMPMTVGEEMILKLKELSKEKTPYQWLRPDHLPFVQQTQLSIAQLDLFSESQYLVLLIRSYVEQSTILSYLFFRNDCSNFGISDGQTQLETSHKAIIGNMANQFANICLSNFQTSKSNEMTFRQHTRDILDARQLEVNRNEEDFLNWKRQWLDSYLIDLSRRDGVNYVISEKAQNEIINADITYEEIKETVDNSIDYICNLISCTPGDDLLIEASFLVMPQKVRSENVKSSTTAQPIKQQNKTILLLDRLEEAANSLYKQGLPITSADVGASMDKPITAPAITDALRKNKVRIFRLFEQYPNRWTTIRQYFKPIINLSAKQNQHLRNVSG